MAFTGDTTGLNASVDTQGVFTDDANQTASLTVDDGTDDSTPGFGPIVAFVAVIVAAAILGRRREDR
ncbi:PGF-CTERM sorting domain-containing protein [Halorubrum sp. CBA1125]|uniref:PGF-CTERM sorting domain-containing protein n=1 Tax=Halorubrum sp. CBA1125 TaxID=2668072 RepID=UPI0012E79E9F|nr:PGF-CTERM sorting domain-containing protein [Halorubrum sp. CBA1125]